MIGPGRSTILRIHRTRSFSAAGGFCLKSPGGFPIAGLLLTRSHAKNRLWACMRLQFLKRNQANRGFWQTSKGGAENCWSKQNRPYDRGVRLRAGRLSSRIHTCTRQRHLAFFYARLVSNQNGASAASLGHTLLGFHERISSPTLVCSKVILVSSFVWFHFQGMRFDAGES